MVAAMDKVGVDGAIYISPFSMYQYDGSYAVSVQKAHPDKFALVKPVNLDDPAVADVIADWKKTPGTVGIRIIMTKESKKEPNDPALSTGEMDRRSFIRTINSSRKRALQVLCNFQRRCEWSSLASLS